MDPTGGKDSKSSRYNFKTFRNLQTVYSKPRASSLILDKLPTGFYIRQQFVSMHIKYEMLLTSNMQS